MAIIAQGSQSPTVGVVLQATTHDSMVTIAVSSPTNKARSDSSLEKLQRGLRLPVNNPNPDDEIEVDPYLCGDNNDIVEGVEVLGREIKPKTARSRRLICCCVCLLCALAVVASAVGLLWPRYPEWEITDLAFTEETKQGLIRVFTDPSFNTTETFDGVAATVNFWNANFVGANAGHGHFKVFYKSEAVGTAEVMPVPIPGRSNVTIHSTASMTITPEAATTLLEGVLKSIELNSVIVVTVIGTLPAKALGLFTVNMLVTCDVSADAIQMIVDPNQMITGHSCTYSIDY